MPPLGVCEWAPPVASVTSGVGQKKKKKEGTATEHHLLLLSFPWEHICLAAADQGLGTGWVCNSDTTLIRQLFPFEPDTYPVAIIPIGYPDETDRPEAKRKPMDEIVTYL